MTPRTRSSRKLLAWAVIALSCPLLTTGPCLTIANESVINGFFDAVTPLLIDYARDQLGLAPLDTTGTTGTGSTASGR